MATTNKALTCGIQIFQTLRITVYHRICRDSHSVNMKPACVIISQVSSAATQYKWDTANKFNLGEGFIVLKPLKFENGIHINWSD